MFNAGQLLFEKLRICSNGGNFFCCWMLLNLKDNSWNHTPMHQKNQLPWSLTNWSFLMLWFSFCMTIAIAMRDFFRFSSSLTLKFKYNTVYEGIFLFFSEGGFTVYLWISFAVWASERLSKNFLSRCLSPFKSVEYARSNTSCCTTKLVSTFSARPDLIFVVIFPWLWRGKKLMRWPSSRWSPLDLKRLVRNMVAIAGTRITSTKPLTLLHTPAA